MASAIQDLIARKNYPKALDLIRAELQKRPTDVRLRMQQADVMILAGRNREAIPVLLGLADEHAADGFTAKAIAFLKRIEKLDPGRDEVEDRLSRLVREKVRQAPAPVSRPATPEFGLEEFDPDAQAPELSLDVAPVSAPTSQPQLSLEASEDPVLETGDSGDFEGLDSISIEAPPPPPPPSATQRARSFLATPLFEGFSQDELAAIIRGLKFLSFSPGEILVGEGAPGDSMFIVASGTVKAYVRHRKGHFIMAKELSEGDFFGEISVITGKPRTATVTAASEVEVLELDKATLDGICKAHPRVRQVLSDYQKQRALDTVEQVIRRD